MSDDEKLPDWIKRLKDGLEDTAAKLQVQADASYRQRGWLPPEEVAAMRSLLRLIRAKAGATPAGQEAAALQQIERICSDFWERQEG